MINRVNFSTPIPFQGEKEVKMLVKKTNELPADSDDITNWGFDLNMMFKRKEISIQDMSEASKQIKEDWKAKLLRSTAKAFEEL